MLTFINDKYIANFTMENFEFHTPTKIIFGKDTQQQVGEELRGRANKVLLHYGQSSIKKIGLYDEVVKSLNKAGVNFVELGGVVPNPRLGLVRQGIELCRKEDVDFILAVGGGSVIDSAKAIAMGVPYDGDVWDFYDKQKPVKEALPVATILTIPAAGSEASAATVITNEETEEKFGFADQKLRPVFSILNPKINFTLPKWQTAAGIADMMTHIFERYFTNTKNVNLTDELCEALLRTIIKHAKIVVEEPENYDSRAEILWASTLAHNGLVGTGREEDWASHVIEHELSAFYDVTHGAGLAVINPGWMEYVYKHDVARFARFGRKVFGLEGEDDEVAPKAIESLREFYQSIGMPTTLTELDIGDEKLEQMAERCTKNCPLGNFVKLGKEDVLKIYKSVLE